MTIVKIGFPSRLNKLSRHFFFSFYMCWEIVFKLTWYHLWFCLFAGGSWTSCWPGWKWGLWPLPAPSSPGWTDTAFCGTTPWEGSGIFPVFRDQVVYSKHYGSEIWTLRTIYNSFLVWWADLTLYFSCCCQKFWYTFKIA